MPRRALLRDWGPWHLLAAWVAYWALLLLAVLGGPALRFWQLTHDPGRHGSATFGLGNTDFRGTIVENGATVWTGSAHLVTIVLWLIVPPLVLYVWWLRSRPARPGDATEPEPPAALGEGAVPQGVARPRERERSA